MSSRLRFTSAILVMVVFTGLSGCKLKPRNVPEVIQVARNLNSPYGSEMDLRIVEFQITNPHLPSGKSIVMKTIEVRDYTDLLTRLGKDVKADVIILDAPADADMNPSVKADMANAVNICAAVKACPENIPALVPSTVSPEHKQAAQMFVDALQKHE